MKTWVIKGVSAVLMTMFVGSSATVTLASESGNDTFPFGGASMALGAVDSLMTMGYSPVLWDGRLWEDDVDYIVLTCGDDRKPYVSTVQLGDSNSAIGQLPSDYDIYLFDVDSSTPIASGTNGGTTHESVSMYSFRRNTVVAKVVHYGDNIAGRYGVALWCKA